MGHSLDPRKTDSASRLHEAAGQLSRWSETPALDAQVLLAQVMGKPRSWVMAHPEVLLSPEQQAQFDQALQQLESGDPLPYVLGHWEFYGLDFSMTPAVLIPRPETELLVEKALEWLRSPKRPAPGAARLRLADIGTGSGCIAVALAVHCPEAWVTASDISYPALQVAQRNAQAQGVGGRMELVQADLLSPFTAGFDLICANLPYIPSRTLATLPVHGREPDLALDGGEDGLVYIDRLLREAQRILAKGCILLEIEASQGQAVRGLGQEAFPQAEVEVHQDLAQKDRLVKIEIF